MKNLLLKKKTNKINKCLKKNNKTHFTLNKTQFLQKNIKLIKTNKN